MADDKIYNDRLTLDEIVFNNRNKAYGAYNLRKTYPRILTKAFVAGTTLFCILAITPFVLTKIREIIPKEKTEVKADLIDLTQPEDEIIEEIEEDTPPPPPPPKEEPVQQEVIQNVVPEPKKEPKVETPPPTITEQKTTTTGLVNQEGEKTTSYTPPPPPLPPSTGTKASTVEVKKVSTTEVYDKVEQEAEFTGGGINGFRRKVSEEFDSSVMDGDEGTLKAEITFVVERDGSITQVKATGSNIDFNREAERTIKSIKTKWKPAKVDGQPVRSRYRLPLTMNFE